MSDSLYLYSMANFREIILPLLELAHARKIVEVGSEYGTFTQELCAYAERKGGQFTSIDPCPQAPAIQFAAQHEGKPYFNFIKKISLEALPGLHDVDAYIIDGDHNYFTVLRELELIQANRNGRPWLVFQHDVCWPFARRDLYYNTSQIPPEFLHPHTCDHAIAPGNPGVEKGGGFQGDGVSLAFARHEGGPRNGVTTAIEDFVAQHGELQFDIITAVFGLGIIYSKDAPWALELAARIKPFVNSLMLDRMEENRVKLYVKVQELKEELEHRSAPSDVLPGPHPLEVFRITDKKTFLRAWDTRLRPAVNEQQKKLPATAIAFEMPGYCVVCGKPVSLKTDYEFASPDETGRLIPAWRERQICQCHLNCRLRSSFHFLKSLLGLDRNAVIYVAEQQTFLFQHIRQTFPRTIGSENLGETIPPGRCNRDGIRNENPAKLSMADASLDCVFSADRLQCVPDYRAALKEIARCLLPGGSLLLTVPFRFDLEQSVLRAESDANGGFIHHQTPIYHYDPVNPQGALCNNEFGWDFLAAIEQAGFEKAELLAFTAPHFGYLGMQYVILARRTAKPAAHFSKGFFPESITAARVSGPAAKLVAV